VKQAKKSRPERAVRCEGIENVQRMAPESQACMNILQTSPGGRTQRGRVAGRSVYDYVTGEQGKRCPKSRPERAVRCEGIENVQRMAPESQACMKIL